MCSTARLLVVFLVLACITDRSAIAADPYRLDAGTYAAAIRQSAGHPNERSRWRGLWSYSNHRHAEARKHFERGAYFGDKPSQYLLGVMNMHGEGGDKDPVAAYIWTDLAAERGSREVLLTREWIWLSLDDAQKRKVQELGPGFHDRYSDAVAMKRTNAQIVRFSRKRTGSRTGGDSGTLTASLGGFSVGSNCPYATSASLDNAFTADIYASSRTDLDEYWRGQDLVLRNIATGTVRVGGLEVVRKP